MYPSFNQHVLAIRAILRHKAGWLADESASLAQALLRYGKIISLEPMPAKVLTLAAYYKNLGALYLPPEILTKEIKSQVLHLACTQTLHLLSAQIAKEADLPDVCAVLEGYYHRGIPRDQLTRLFQVVNAWVSCRHPKGWRPALTIHDSVITLQQRAEMEWSDPVLVAHFLEHFPDCRGQP